jgi:hypothetical protein
LNHRFFELKLTYPLPEDYISGRSGSGDPEGQERAMNGQWIGHYSGTNNGLLILELDDFGATYEGTVMALNADAALPAVAGNVSAPKGEEKFKIRIPLYAVQRHTAQPYSAEGFKLAYPTATAPSYADAEWEVSATEISVKWQTDIGTHGEGRIKKSEGAEPSSLQPLTEVQNWAAFKDYATKLESHAFLFRGQENNRWKLRTSFHRTNRASLIRFMNQDVATLHRHLSGLTPHRFNLGDALDYAAFLALVQHHGYPTPFLDWTHSPYIAAYFAFRGLDRNRVTRDQKVRIHILDGKSWNSRMERAGVMSPAFLHMTILEPLAINNQRVIPQQSASLVTNVDDLEWYIRDKEMSAGRTFLSAIDIPASEKPNVMKELEVMGIGAGSLFPGLDGACKGLKERFFED